MERKRKKRKNSSCSKENPARMEVQLSQGESRVLRLGLCSKMNEVRMGISAFRGNRTSELEVDALESPAKAGAKR